MCVSADRRHNECVGQDQTQSVCVGIEPFARACRQQLIECARSLAPVLLAALERWPRSRLKGSSQSSLPNQSNQSNHRAPSCCSVRGTVARPVAHCGLPAGPGQLLLAGSNLQRFSCASRRTPHHQPLRSARPHPVLSARVVAHRPAALYEAQSLAQSLIATSRAAGRTPVKHSALPSSHARSCCSVCCWPAVYLLQPRQYSSARAG